MNTFAAFNPNEIHVIHTVRPDVNREFLTVSCPNGWDDVKHIKDKILTYDGRKFSYTGWNSDRNECFFAKPLNTDVQYATFV